MILVIDNYDSFTYNLVQDLQVLGQEVQVFRNDALSVAQVLARQPDALVISPGPGRPQVAGISMQLVSAAAGRLPVLGVCLGHQAIGAAFGGKIVQSQELMHGKTSAIHHGGDGIYDLLPSPFQATRYHSLVLERESLPDCLKVTAWTDDGTVMGVRHQEHVLEGVQFHPESILTRHGKALLQRFLQRAVKAS